jgi:hypothetical protein
MMVQSKQQIVIYKTNFGMVTTAPTRPSKQALRRMAGVTLGTYAAELVDRFHHFFVGRAVDLREEYEKYYVPEYVTIPHFLYHKYAMTYKHVKAIEPLIAKGYFVGLVRETWGRDWQMESLLDQCETALTILMKSVKASFAEINNERKASDED